MQCPHIGVVSKPQKCLTHENSTNGGCPNEFYCLIYESTVFGIGHCCPKPQLLCPAGLPDPVNTCAKDMPNKCDSSTHLCHGLSFGARNRDRDVEVCCKKPCANEEFYSEGKCYKTRHFGQTCEIDQQCQVKGSICKKGK